MRSRRVAYLTIALALPLWGLSTAARADEPADLAVLEDVTVATTAKGVTVRLDFSSPRSPQVSVLHKPERLLFDFPQTRLKGGLSRVIEVKHKVLTAVRAGQYSDEPAVARVVFDLTTRQSPKFVKAESGKVLFIGLAGGAGKPDAKSRPAPGIEVKDCRWSREAERAATLVLGLSAPADVRSFHLADPDRLVFDVDGARLAAKADAPSRGNGIAAKLTLSQFSADTVRCQVELKVNAGFVVTKRDNPARIEIRFIRGETRGRLVVIDPGHGGKDNGTTGYHAGLYEKNVVLDIGRRAAELLRGKGVTVQMTRPDDTFIPLSERPGLANQQGADLFVSIHCNAMPEGKKGERSGTEVYWYTDPSSPFAQVMLDAFCSVTKTTARGTYQRKFVVVREAHMPAVLVETGYLDHPGEGKQLENPEFRQKCALGLVRGVMRYLERLPSRQDIETASAPRRRREARG